MAKIRKLYDEAIKPDGTKQVIYPITSTRAVYTTSNITVDAVLNEGYRFGGVVKPTDSPAFLDQRVYYAASIPGVYTNFGGISVNGGEAAFLLYDGTSWSKGLFGGAGYSNLSGFVVVDSIQDLPREKTTLGYLIKDESLPEGFSKEILYVWVGEHGDTLGGLYQNCGQLRGASAYEVAVWNGYEGTPEEWLNDPVNGIKGISVQSFELIGEYDPSESAVNTYKVTLSNGESLMIPIKNGTGIKQIDAEIISYENGGISTYKITLSDNREYTFQVRNGKTSAGLFSTAEALAEKYPTPEVGDYAFVGEGFPAAIYVCTTAGEWSDSGETYEGDSIDLQDYAKKEDVGDYEQNPEFVRVVTDSEGKILYGVRIDGEFVFGTGVPQSIKDYIQSQGIVSKEEVERMISVETDRATEAENAETLRAQEAENALSEGKVDKVEGKALIDEDYASSVDYQVESPEFIQVTVDSEDKVIEGTRADGSKFIGGDLTVQGRIDNPEIHEEIDTAIEEMKAEVQQMVEESKEKLSYFDSVENPEYLQVTTDSEDKVLEGIKSDGTKVIGGDLQVNGNIINDGIQGQIDAAIEEMQEEVHEMLEESSEKLSYFESAENPEWIQVTTDKDGKILEGITSEGKKKVMVETEYPNGIPSEIKEYVDERIPTVNTIEVILPDKIYAVVGDTLQLFFKGMIKAVNPYNYDIVCIANAGKQYPRYFEWTPESARSINLTVKVKDDNGNLLGENSTIIEAKAAVAQPASEKRVLFIGDSLTAAGAYLLESYRRLTGNGGSPEGNGFGNISYIGRKKYYENIYAEGNSGWSWSDYVTIMDRVYAECYTLTVDAVSVIPSVGAVYKDENNREFIMQWDYSNTKLKMSVALETNLPTSGVLTKISGSGDDTIAYTAAIKSSMNPFWNDAENRLDFPAYINKWCNSQVDVVYTLLTWNALGVEISQNNFTNIINYAKTFYRHIHANYPNVKIKMMAVQIPDTREGMNCLGAPRENGYTDMYALIRVALNMNKVYQEICNDDEFKDYVELISLAPQVDSEYNMPFHEKDVNTRNSSYKEYVGNNDVHPDNKGYYQIADAVYRSFIANYCQ